MTPSQGHRHSYKRVHGKDNTYRCLDPHCTHFITAEFLEGKAADCASCGQEFVIGKKQLRLKRILLKCDACKTRTEFGGKVRDPSKQRAAGEATLTSELQNALRKLL